MRVLARGAARVLSRRRRVRLDALLRALPAPRLARAALLVVDDLDAAPHDRATRSRRKLQRSQLDYVVPLARPRRRRWPRTTWDCELEDCSTACSRAGGARRRSPTRLAAGDARGRGGARPGARARQRRGGRGDRRRVPARALRRRASWAREAAASGNPVVPLVARAARARRRPRPARSTAAPRARTSSTRRRCSSSARALGAAARGPRAARADAAAALAARAPRDADGRAHAAPAGRARPRSASRPRAGWPALDAARGAPGGVPRPAAQLGGAAGTLAARRRARRCSRAFAARARPRRSPLLPVAHRAQPDRRARRGARRSPAGAVAKVGRRRRAARPDRGRRGARGGGGRGGSSSMPHKRNPVAAISARGVRPPGARAWSRRCSPRWRSEHERAAGAWHAEWAPLRALLVATGSAAAWLRDVPRGPRGRRRAHAQQPRRRSDDGAVASAAALVDRALAARAQPS